MEECQNKPPVDYLNKKQMWQILALIVVVGTIWSFLNQQRNAGVEKVQRTFPVMGTIAQVTFYGGKELCGQAADTVRESFEKVSKACNIFDPDSELSRLNKTAYDKPFKCSDQLWQMLQAGRRAYKVSDGAFDITARPLMVLWGFYRKRGESLPSKAETAEALLRTGLDKVIFNDKEKSVKFTVKGMSFDLGGYAKGAAVDLAVDAVSKLGVNCGIINLGGNMRCLSNPPPGRKSFVIGVRDPFNKSAVCGKVQVLNKALATSGNYERYVTIKGKQYTHIMNVKTGRPVADIYSVTVIAPTALDTDIYSTSVFIKGVEYARSVIRHRPDISFLIIRPDADGKTKVYRVNGLENRVKWGELKF